MDRLLFLDFDGVLHTNEPPRDLRFASNLAPVVERLNLKVVITSTWREVYNLHAMVQKLGPLGRHVIGKTPVIATDELPERGGRQVEIEQWLRANAKPGHAWVALDDDEEHFRSSCTRVFLTDKRVGLTLEVAQSFEAWCRKTIG